MRFGYATHIKGKNGRYEANFHTCKVLSNDLEKVVNIFFNSHLIAARATQDLLEAWINVGTLSEVTLPEYRWEDAINDDRPEVVTMQKYQYFQSLGSEPAIILNCNCPNHQWYVWDGEQLWTDMRTFRQSDRKGSKQFVITESQLNLK